MPRRPPTLLLPESAVLKGVLALAPLFDVTLRRQNTGAMRNPTGRLVRYGEAGASDLIGFAGPSWGAKAGATILIECKKEDWEPPRPPRPGKPAGERRMRWGRQLARLREVNEAGGFGFWTDAPSHAEGMLAALRTGRYRVAFGDDEGVELEEAG